MAALAFYPRIARRLAYEYAAVAREERKLSDILVGYLDPADHVPSAQEIAEQNANNASGDSDETETGPDPVEAKKRSTAVKRQGTQHEEVAEEKGHNTTEVQTESNNQDELRR